MLCRTWQTLFAAVMVYSKIIKSFSLPETDFVQHSADVIRRRYL